ncbi:MAG: hypothetical protein KAR24_03365 [Candidatus Pacebacteria bacterium]|nr:hypothetical protein [Candidatus Paceibacterota bacterium]
MGKIIYYIPKIRTILGGIFPPEIDFVPRAVSAEPLVVKKILPPVKNNRKKWCIPRRYNRKK